MADENKEVKGALLDSLNRSRKQITNARAQSIGEDAELVYRRRVEDLNIRKKQLERARDNRLDMSPDNAMSLSVAKNFNADEFAESDLKDSVELRTIDIKLDVAQERYEFLFGKTLSL
jgi:hypothetical protein